MYYGETANGALPSPEALFQIYKAEFDLAYEERTMFILTQHPHVSGHRSRIAVLDRLVSLHTVQAWGLVCDHGTGCELREAARRHKPLEMLLRPNNFDAVQLSALAISLLPAGRLLA